MTQEIPKWLELEVLPDEYMHWRRFTVSIVGVTHRNPDRTDRQKILMDCEWGEPIRLVRKPDNKHDAFAIAVVRMTGQQIGWMPGGDFLLASHLDQGGIVSAKILKITGGGSDGYYDRAYGCVIEIGKWVPDPSKLAVFWDEGARIQHLIDEAKALETKSPLESIKKYVNAVNGIKELDQHPIGRRYRRVRYPINRLSLVLERQVRYKECCKVITWWQGIDDHVGLLATDARSVSKRLDRVKRFPKKA